MTQVLLVVTLFSEDAFVFALNLTSALALIPFLLVAAYGLKLAVTGETYEGTPHGRALAVTALATLYTVFLIWAAGPAYLLASFIVYAPSTVLFVMARREQGRRVFDARERVVFAASAVGGTVGVVALATGAIAF